MKTKIMVLSVIIFLITSILSAQTVTNISISIMAQTGTNINISVFNIIQKTINQSWINNLIFLNDPGVKIFEIFISIIVLLIFMSWLALKPKKNIILIILMRILKGIFFILFIFSLVFLFSLGERILSFILLLIMMIFYFITSEMSCDSVIVNAFTLPDSFLTKHQGYTGQVLASIIIDEIYKIKNLSKKFDNNNSEGDLETDEMSYIPNQNGIDIPIEVGKVTFSIKGIVQYLKKTGCLEWLFKGKNYVVDGDIVEKINENNKWMFYIRVQDKDMHVTENFIIDGDMDLFKYGVFIIVNTSSNKAMSYYKIADYCQEQENFDEAIKQYNNAIKNKQDFVEAHNDLGIVYSVMEEFDKAIEEYKLAIKYKPDYSNAYYNLGNAYIHKNEFDKAIQKYQTAIKHKKDHAAAHNNLGNSYNHKEEFDKAIEEYKLSLKYNPNDAKTYYNLGNAYYAKKEFDKAIEEYKLAIKYKPEYSKAYSNLGLTYFQKKELDKAINQYQKAIKYKPDNVFAYFNLGLALRNKGQQNDAKAAFQKCIDLGKFVSDSQKNIEEIEKGNNSK